MARLVSLRGVVERAVEGSTVELVLPLGGRIVAVIPEGTGSALPVRIEVGNLIMFEAPEWSLGRWPLLGRPVEVAPRQRVLVVSPGRVCVRYLEHVDLV